LKELEELRDGPTFASLTKKEALTLTREITKLDNSLGGIRNMGGLPDAVFVVDVSHEKIAISEASKLKIPIVAIVDTNCNPSGIDYVIPGNDDSGRAIKLYLQGIVDAIVDAKSRLPVEKVTEEKEEKRAAKKPLKAKKKVVTKKTAQAVADESKTEEAESKQPKIIKKSTHAATRETKKQDEAEAEIVVKGSEEEASVTTSESNKGE
ncbi:MAG: 30S ribosomal protein S2, partial [Gammaproteobacteria bacterium]|nr:30S ribosomal protein S2 [Gammaproteobacteria bacterium]